MKRTDKANPANRYRLHPAKSGHKHKFIKGFDKISGVITRTAGRPGAFIGAFGLVAVWGITGPFFDFSETWQLFINSATTIVTFLMVFIIQQSANKDTMAVQLKLNELIACQENASNRLINVEALTPDELEVLKKFYVRLTHLAQSENDIHRSHSIDEAHNVHKRKKRILPHADPIRGN